MNCATRFLPRETTSGLDKAVESIVGKADRFNGKDVTNYLETFKAEMLMRDVSDDRRLSTSPWVVTPSIHAEVPEKQADCRSWLELKERLLERYGFDDLLRLLKELMEWVESLGKGRNTSVLIQEFER